MNCSYCGGEVNRALHQNLGYICGCGSSWRAARSNEIQTLDQVIEKTIDSLEKMVDTIPGIALPPPPPRPKPDSQPRQRTLPLFTRAVPSCPNCNMYRKCASCLAELARQDLERMEAIRSQMRRSA